ncbi:MAG: HAD family hydrolase [Pseudonocardia sp.]
MQAPRLVATDVDGTLLDPSERVPPRSVAVIDRLRASGTEFVLATGRPPRWIPPVTEQLGSECLAVCANGAVLYDGVTDRVVWSRALDVDTLAALAAAAVEALPLSGVAVERVPTRAFDTDETFLAEPDYLHAWPGKLHVASRAEVLSEPAVKLLVRCPGLSSAAMVTALEPLIGELADATFSTPNGLVELAVPGVTKATGLAEVARRLGIAREDVVAFGDMPNDLEMLRWAGHGVAMGNADPALKEIADEITADHGEDGLAVVLERWF